MQLFNHLDPLSQTSSHDGETWTSLSTYSVARQSCSLERSRNRLYLHSYFEQWELQVTLKPVSVLIMGEIVWSPFIMRTSGLWYRLQFVIHARVPILKVVSGHQRISCDISIDNLEGLLKSRFLFWISEIDGRFRDLVLLVSKTHARLCVFQKYLLIQYMYLSL